MEQFKGKATASLVLGIVAVVLCWFSATIWLGIIGLVCGIIGLVLGIQVRKGCQAAGVKPDGMATAGFVLSIIGLALCALMLICCGIIVGAAGCVACQAANYLH